MIVFGIVGLLFTIFGVLGLVAARDNKDVQYSSRELFWMSLAGIGNLVAAALLLSRMLA